MDSVGKSDLAVGHFGNDRQRLDARAAILQEGAPAFESLFDDTGHADQFGTGLFDDAGQGADRLAGRQEVVDDQGETIRKTSPPLV
jgi:hypothetical protein